MAYMFSFHCYLPLSREKEGNICKVLSYDLKRCSKGFVDFTQLCNDRLTIIVKLTLINQISSQNHPVEISQIPMIIEDRWLMKKNVLKQNENERDLNNLIGIEHLYRREISSSSRILNSP